MQVFESHDAQLPTGATAQALSNAGHYWRRWDTLYLRLEPLTQAAHQVVQLMLAREAILDAPSSA